MILFFVISESKPLIDALYQIKRTSNDNQITLAPERPCPYIHFGASDFEMTPSCGTHSGKSQFISQLLEPHLQFLRYIPSYIYAYISPPTAKVDSEAGDTTASVNAQGPSGDDVISLLEVLVARYMRNGLGDDRLSDRVPI